MREFVIIYLPFLLSLLTIYSMIQAGNKKQSGWVVAICNQALWLTWIVLSQSWGLLPMNLALWFVFIRNYKKWRLEVNK